MVSKSLNLQKIFIQNETDVKTVSRVEPAHGGELSNFKFFLKKNACRPCCSTTVTTCLA